MRSTNSPLSRTHLAAVGNTGAESFFCACVVHSEREQLRFWNSDLCVKHYEKLTEDRIFLSSRFVTLILDTFPVPDNLPFADRFKARIAFSGHNAIQYRNQSEHLFFLVGRVFSFSRVATHYLSNQKMLSVIHPLAQIVVRYVYSAMS